MKFSLDPPSGHVNSYLDIKFKLEFENIENAEIEIFNKSNGEKLEILAISNGFIKNETTIVVNNTKTLEGYINIFNKDKLNILLKDKPSVDIEAVVSFIKKESVYKQNKIVTFYNESQSVDREIIPFDLNIHNKLISVENNEPLKITIMSNNYRKHELSIKDSIDASKFFTFDIMTKPGETTFEIPLPVLYYELNIEKFHWKNFDLYWSKFEGVDYMKVMNRKYIKIQDSTIKFSKGNFKPLPQKRMGPVSNLDKNFVLSDRYFVHTFKEFSGFGSDTLNIARLKRLNFVQNESQQMQNLSASLQRHSDIKEIKHSTRQTELSRKNIQSFGNSRNKQFFETLNESIIKDGQEQFSTFEVSKTSTENKKSGCGCSRKK